MCVMHFLLFSSKKRIFSSIFCLIFTFIYSTTDAKLATLLTNKAVITVGLFTKQQSGKRKCLMRRKVVQEVFSVVSSMSSMRYKLLPFSATSEAFKS